MAVADDRLAARRGVFQHPAHALADGDSPWLVSDDGIRLVQMNMCRPDDRTYQDVACSSTVIIATLGGTLSTSLEDDVWTLKAHIPKHSRNTKRQARPSYSRHARNVRQSWSQ